MGIYNLTSRTSCYLYFYYFLYVENECFTSLKQVTIENHQIAFNGKDFMGDSIDWQAKGTGYGPFANWILVQGLNIEHLM